MKLSALLLLAGIISLAFTQQNQNQNQNQNQDDDDDDDDMTLAGRYAAEYASSHDFRDRRDIDRVRTVRVDFEEEFDSRPKVAVSLYSFSLNYGSAGVWVEVDDDDIRRDYFLLKIHVPEGAGLNSIGVSWIASVSNRINFRYYYSDDYSLQDMGNGPQLQGHLNFPDLNNNQVDALAFIAGFQFEGTDDPLLHVEVDDVDRNSVDLDIFVNEDNEPSFVRILVIHFRESYAASLLAESDYNGDLYRGSGDRHDYSNENIYRDDYLGYNALSGFSFEDHLGYRLRTTVTFSDVGNDRTRARFDFKTWKSTKVHKAWSGLLYRPE